MNKTDILYIINGSDATKMTIEILNSILTIHGNQWEKIKVLENVTFESNYIIEIEYILDVNTGDSVFNVILNTDKGGFFLWAVVDFCATNSGKKSIKIYMFDLVSVNAANLSQVVNVEIRGKKRLDTKEDSRLEILGINLYEIQ